jgi:hexosaminidase
VKKENWYTPIEKVYRYEPVPKELSSAESKYVLGAQGNVWTEYITNPRKVEYMLFPRISALSEVLWTPIEKKNWKDFEKRLIPQFQRYDLWKVNYSKAHFGLNASALPSVDFNGVHWKLTSNHPNASIKYKSIAGTVTYREPVKITKTEDLSATLVIANKPVMQIHQQAKRSH